ncbi:hypothetical protein E8E12_010934 [Didymella heteroderae]|uniref:Uncharacterized protein n=1 Tax=Didymella heteroderae TaxID=1769908 RepID=A0A9P5C491_9PLEO|nr:hypothetical protein E8E12_010934 [Didymella heteroderae]
MTGEKRSADLSNRLNVKRGGKLISKTLGKSSSPPSISAPPNAAIGAPKVKKDEVQRHKNTFHDMLRGSPREKDGGHTASLNAHVSGATQTPTYPGHGTCGDSNTARATTAIAVGGRRSSEHRKRSAQESERLPARGRSSEQHTASSPHDDRLADLEKALLAAKEEAAVLRHELDRVKQDAQASAEVSRYQAQHHAPSEDAEMQTDLGSSVQDETDEQEREQHADLLAQNHALRNRLAELQDQLLSQSIYSEAVHSDSDWNAMTLRLHEAEKESHARLQQLLSLKSSISTLTRIDSQVSDTELAENFSQLANRVREWVISNYRRSKMNSDRLSEESAGVLRAIKKDFENIDVADRLPLYQAVVSRILMQIFDEPIILGMPDGGLHAGLRSFAESAQSGGVDVREWKRVTLQVVERCTPAAALYNWRSQRLASLAVELENIMLSISSTEIAPSARSALISIMNAAADLQRTLCLQKAGYNVIFFHALHKEPHRFDEQAMESINHLEERMDDDCEAFARHRDFAFCVFPCLEKIGNDVQNIVFKARVCCGVR